MMSGHFFSSFESYLKGSDTTVGSTVDAEVLAALNHRRRPDESDDKWLPLTNFQLYKLDLLFLETEF